MSYPITLSPPPLPPILPAPYADLYAYPSFRITREDDTTIFVQGIVGNRGNVVAGQSVAVVVGITTYRNDVFRRTDERRSRMGKGLQPGETAFTERTSAPMRFRADGYSYILEILVDLNHELYDLTRSNNYFRYSYWAYPLGELLDEQSNTFTIEVDAAEASTTTDQNPSG